MVLEVVSPRSEKKDTEVLPKLYHKAGISEYWLVDVRGDNRRFDILLRRRGGYVAARKSSGWQTSKVFGRSFRLVEGRDRLGSPEFTLAAR